MFEDAIGKVGVLTILLLVIAAAATAIAIVIVIVNVALLVAAVRVASGRPPCAASLAPLLLVERILDSLPLLEARRVPSARAAQAL